jgi:serine protease Do
MHARTKRSKLLWSVIIVAAIFLLGMGAERIISRGERSTAVDSIIPAAQAQEQVTIQNIPSVIEKALPAVVRIDTKKVLKVKQQVPAMFQDPFFRQFFGDDFYRRFNVPREQVERFRGSGVIISKDGYILTNNHVVTHPYTGEIMDEVDVVLPPPDNRTFGAKVIGTDPRTEVAVVKIDAKDLPTIGLGHSSDLRLGQTVLAIGYPFSVGITVTEGIVSGLAKSLEDLEQRQGVYVGFIQTDAAINPGNSGGALIDTKGELIGINTLIVSNTGSFAGIGFAIPVDQARTIMEDLIQHGSVSRGYLGVGFDDLTPDKAQFFNLKITQGAIVTNVATGSPASKAGIEANDVITAINGKPITDSGDLVRSVGSMRPGDKADIDLMRNGKSMKVTVEIGKTPGQVAEKAQKSTEKAKPELALLSGVGIEDLNDEYRQQLRLPREIQGVVVTSVDADSPAADEGLQEGDVIFQVNLKPVADLNEFSAALKNVKDDRVMFTVYRQGGRFNIVIKP